MTYDKTVKDMAVQDGLKWVLARAILPVLVCVTAGGTQAQSKDATEDDFVIMTWNLEWFFDSNDRDNRSSLAKEKSAPSRELWDWRRDAVASSLAEVQANVVALQEAESTKVLSYLNDSLEDNHKLKYRVTCLDGAEPFTEQDVALLYNEKMWLQRIAHNGQTKKMYRSGDYYNVFKHIEATFETGSSASPEKITIVNLHLRARSEKVDIRVRQARLVHHWIAERVKAGENIIVLGDLNSEEPVDSKRADSDVAIVCGKHTDDPSDDLIDLHTMLPADQRQTHLLEGRAFDRIIVSPALMEDDPNRVDLVLRTVERPRHLSVKGSGPDEQDAHWNHYWEMEEGERDLSDHWPVVARFQLK